MVWIQLDHRTKVTCFPTWHTQQGLTANTPFCRQKSNRHRHLLRKQKTAVRPASTKCTLAKRTDTVTFKHTWRKPGLVCLLRHQQDYNKETHKLAPSIRKSEMQKELQEHNLTPTASQSQGKIPSGEKEQRDSIIYSTDISVVPIISARVRSSGGQSTQGPS